MIHYVGIDIMEINRVERAMVRWGDRFLHRVYTEAELKQSHRKPSSLAARFASKEAVMKLLGTGKNGIGWRDIETLSEPSGKPSVHLCGKAQAQAKSLGIDRLAISLSHSREYTIACIIGDNKVS